MKAKYLFICAALALPLFVSCNKDGKEEQGKTNYQEMTFTASIPDAGTVSCGWKAGDAISIFDGKANQKFVTSEEGSSVTFSGTANASAKEYMAVTPYDKALSRKGGKVTLNIASAQTGVSDGFDPSYNYAVAYTTGKDLKFVNIPAYLKLNINAAGYNVVSATIEAVGGEQLSGDVNVALAATPSVETTGGSNKVILTGKAINGTYYVAVVPSTLSQGLKIALTDENDSRAEVTVSSATIKTGEVADLGEIKPTEWKEATNPNPTQVAGALIMKATFKEADFNIVRNGDFEAYPDQDLFYRTKNQASNGEQIALISKTTGYNSTYGMKIDNPTPGIWQRLEQPLQLNRNCDYTFTIDAKVSAENKNCYAGVDAIGHGLYEISGWQGQWEAEGTWKSYTLPVSIGMDSFWGYAYCGMWGDAGCVIEADNIRLIPTGYTAKSMDPVSSEILGRISNATFDEVEGLGKVIGWMDADNSVKLAFSNVVINGTTYPTAIANTTGTPESGLQINKFNKTSGILSQIVPVEDGQLSVVPDDAFIRDGKTYLHYYATLTEDAANINNWTTDYATFVVSEDNGLTWTAANEKVWAGAGTYAEAAFVNRDGYTYMIGTKAGRDTWAFANMFGARIADGKDFTDPTAYEYWANPGWTTEGEPADNAANLLSVGPRAECDVIYNAKFGRYMMIHRADSFGGIVYRDSAGPDENGHWFWSCEKVLTDDTLTGVIGSVSVLKVEEDGSIIFLASQQ